MHMSDTKMKQSGNLKGAESDARKTITEVPHVATQSTAYSADAEPCVVEAKPVFQQEQLADGVGQVYELDNQVRNGQVVAVALATHQAAVSGQCRQLAIAAVVASLALRQQVSVDLQRQRRKHHRHRHQ